MDDVVVHAWDAVKHRFQKTSDPISPDDIASMRERLQKYFFNTFPVFAGRAFEIPSEYERFLSVVDGRLCLPSAYDPCWFRWLSPQAVVDLTEFWCEPHDFLCTDKSEMWITIAEWSDKHSIWLSCDRAAASFGQVMDCHDGHPWMGSSGANTIEASGFVEFLGKVDEY